MTADVFAVIVFLAVIITAGPFVAEWAFSTPPRRPRSAGPSAIIGAHGWHACHLDDDGYPVWVDPVARPTAVYALSMAQAEWARLEWARAGGAQ